MKYINKKIFIGIAANILFTIFEFAMGLLTNSLALISDGALNLADVLSLCITVVAQKLASARPTKHKTFGYGRATIAAAFINGCFLLGFAIYIFIKAYERIYTPETIEGSVVMFVGFLGILVNGGAATLLLESIADLNVRSAYLNMVFDALASAAALSSGLIIYFTGYSLIDPIISSFIGILLLISAYKILSEVIHLFFEGVPAQVHIEEVEQKLLEVPEIVRVLGMNIWAISTQTSALNAQLLIDKSKIAHNNQIIQKIKTHLKQQKQLGTVFEHVILELRTNT